MCKVASVVVYVFDTNYLILTSMYFFFIYALSLSNALNTYTTDGINYWNSTTDFVPTQNKSYGTLQLKTGFHMTFDIFYYGKTVNAAWENIFRIGHAGHSLTDYKCSKNDRFPAMWVDDNSNAFIFDVSDKSNCFRQYKNYIILPNILYSITISYNSSWVYISLNNTIIVNEPRKDTTDINIIGTDVYIYISTATGTPANVILSNIKILSYYDNSYIPPSNNPSFNPTISPTYNPSYIPTISPTTNIQQTNIPTLLPSINNSPTKKPTTFFPSIFTQSPDDTIFTTDSSLYSTEKQLHATTIKSTITNTIYEYINTIYETDISSNNISKENGGLSFEVIFYILTGCAMGGILFCVCTCCCFGCIINKKIKTLATDETNIENENILSIKKQRESMDMRDNNNNNNNNKTIIHLSNKNNNHSPGETMNKIRIQTMSDDSNDESIDSQNIINGSSPTTSPSNCKYSSPSSVMSKSIHSFNGIHSNTNSPNTKFIKRSQLQKHLSPKNSNNKNNIRRVNTKSVPIIDINQLLNEDITLNNHKVAIQRNEISKSNADIGAITIDFMEVLTERTIQSNNNNNETDNETDNDSSSSTDNDTDDDCKIISTNHSLLSPLNNNNNHNNKTLGDGYERGHFFECRNIINKSKSKQVTTFSNPSTNYSLYVHTAGTPTNNKYKSLSNNNSNVSTNNMNQIAIDKSKQYQIQIDMATDDNNNTLNGEHDDATDDDESISNNSDTNSQYENEQLYDVKSLGDIEMESNQQERENEEEEDMKNETIMNTTSHPNNIKPNSAKSFKSYKTINNRIINRTHSHHSHGHGHGHIQHTQHTHTHSAQHPHATLMNNISESGGTQSAKVFLQLPATADSQMSAESISSNQSLQSSTSCSTSVSNCSNSSSSSYSSSNSSSSSCSSSSNSSSQYSSNTNNSNNSNGSSNSSSSSNSNSSIHSTTYNKTHYTNTTNNTNNTPLIDVSNNDKFHHGNNPDNMSQSTAYYTNTPHSL